MVGNRRFGDLYFRPWPEPTNPENIKRFIAEKYNRDSKTDIIIDLLFNHLFFVVDKQSKTGSTTP